MEKVILALKKQKQLCLTSKRHAGHPFTDQNTQHVPLVTNKTLRTFTQFAKLEVKPPTSCEALRELWIEQAIKNIQKKEDRAKRQQDPHAAYHKALKCPLILVEIQTQHFILSTSPCYVHY